MIQTLDSLVPPTEIVSQSAWIRSTRFEWGAMVITPLAPGVASYSATYTEHVTDTTGTETALSGAQQGVVRHEADGWRLVAVRSSHPMAMHRAQDALARAAALGLLGRADSVPDHRWRPALGAGMLGLRSALLLQGVPARPATQRQR